MPQFIITNRLGTEFPIEGESGSTLMELIRDAGVQDNFALCGGNCSCATCHVYIEGDLFEQLPAMSEAEDELLDSSDHRRATSRLSCQVAASEAFVDARVIVAPED